MVKRNQTFDIIKAFAIWLVVLGHCIQYLSGWDYWNNRLFQFIYSFHMPLFFMVSGFFFASSVNLTFKQFFLKKSLTLLLPCFVCGIIISIFSYTDTIHLLINIIVPEHWPFWFLKGLFIVQVVAYMCMRLAKHIGRNGKNVFFWAAILSLIVYFLPYMSIARVMIPVFWIGSLVRRYYDCFVKYHLQIFVFSLVLFIILFHFWNAMSMYYYARASVTVYHVIFGRNGYTVLTLVRLFYRILIGVAGSLAVVAIFHSFRRTFSMVSKIGSATAGIYILQTFVLEYGGTFIGKHWGYLASSLNMAWTTIFLFVVSIMLVITLSSLYQLIHKSSLLDLLLFGCGQKTKTIINIR